MAHGTAFFFQYELRESRTRLGSLISLRRLWQLYSTQISTLLASHYCVPSSRFFLRDPLGRCDASFAAATIYRHESIVYMCSLASATRPSGLLAFLCRSWHKSSIGRPSARRQQRNYFFHFSFAVNERLRYFHESRADFLLI